ncbi:MAG: hypothetical protein HGA98_00410 [Deltaproteobacteria bacterium]|nr:hypothetical protein [Deltaproteobacteria bacterium]
MPRRPALACAALLLALLALAGPSAAATLQGVTYPDSVQVEGKTLKLQGLGLRKKLVFSVYVGALYLTTPTSDAAAAARADEPKRIALKFLRDVDAAAIREAWEDGFFKNAQEKLSTLKPRIDAFLKIAAPDMKKGQELSFTYAPGAGTRVAVNGADRGAVEGRDFAEALFLIWLGDQPPTQDLKKGMLGGP